MAKRATGVGKKKKTRSPKTKKRLAAKQQMLDAKAAKKLPKPHPKPSNASKKK